MLLIGNLLRLFCGNNFVVGSLVTRSGWSGTVVARAVGRAIGRANAKDASSKIRHGSTYEPSRMRCMQKKTKGQSLPRAKTHAACALNLKVPLLPTSQHSTAQTQASKRLPRPGQARDLRFMLSHVCACSSHVPSLNLTQIFCLVSARSSTRSPPRRDSVALGPMLVTKSPKLLHPLCSTRKP